MPWVFERIAKPAPNAKATVSLDRTRERSGLFTWEVFVTGAAKRATHGEEARATVDAFNARWPDLKSDVTAEPTFNLAVAAALAAGLAIDARRDRGALSGCRSLGPLSRAERALHCPVGQVEHRTEAVFPARSARCKSQTSVYVFTRPRLAAVWRWVSRK
jgi:hypothetical protein